MPEFSEFYIHILFIFEMQEINGALFSNARGLFFLPLLFAPSTVISPVTTIYDHRNHKNQILELML